MFYLLTYSKNLDDTSMQCQSVIVDASARSNNSTSLTLTLTAQPSEDSIHWFIRYCADKLFRMHAQMHSVMHTRTEACTYKRTTRKRNAYDTPVG